jgi:ABC-type multidrug transport system fused ATPase/permease subunit
LLRAKIQFFDSNPIGRIITRFTKDIVVIDSQMSLILALMTSGAFRSITVFIMLCIINPWLIIACTISGILMILFQKKGSRAMIET